MRETEKRERTVVEEFPLSIKCDRCGKETLQAAPHGDYDREGTAFRLDFGYGSRFDLDLWKVDTCDDCAEWLRGEFKTLTGYGVG